MHDAISAEKAGILATAIITDRFRETAQVMARVSGMPDYSFVVIPHPISNNTEEILRAKAEDAVRQCLAILLNRSEN
ncbi:MAG: hypothetical protein AB7P69_25585 [Candidatus Binatia bacterium]